MGDPPSCGIVLAFDASPRLLPDVVVLDTSFVVDALLTGQRGHKDANAYLLDPAMAGTRLYFNRLLELELAEAAYKIAMKERFGNRRAAVMRTDGRALRRASRLFTRVGPPGVVCSTASRGVSSSSRMLRLISPRSCAEGSVLTTQSPAAARRPGTLSLSGDRVRQETVRWPHLLPTPSSFPTSSVSRSKTLAASLILQTSYSPADAWTAPHSVLSPGRAIGSSPARIHQQVRSSSVAHGW